MNSCHIQKGKLTLFGSKYIYPPSDYFIKLATKTNSCIINNCTIGTNISDILQYTPIPKKYHKNLSQHDLIKLIQEYDLKSKPLSNLNLAIAKKSFFSLSNKRKSTNDNEKDKSVYENTLLRLRTRRRSSIIPFPTSTPTTPNAITMLDNVNDHIELQNELHQYYITEWNISNADQLVASEANPPLPPMPTWQKNETDDFVIKLPDDQEVLLYPSLVFMTDLLRQ
jgi:hypothetical protein